MSVNLKCFVGKSQLPYFNKNDYLIQDIITESKQLFELVFSPDPNTGNPRSDVFYLLSGENPEFQQFIKDRLLSSHPQMPVTDSPDEALELTNKNLWTVDEFYSHVRSYVINKLNQTKDA